MSTKRIVSVKDVEELLVCLPGIQKARVVVNDWGAIEEIHILTGLDRSPKQIVRDVQSALKAQWDITVDRRKVSVAQVKTSLPASQGRLRYVGLEVKSDARTSKSEVCVTLERSQEDQVATYSGKVEADGTEISLLSGVAQATCLAVNLTIEPPNAFFVDDVNLVSVGHKKAVAVLVGLVTPKRNHEELLGSALVRREAREASVRATLDAMNRRLEVLPQRGSLKAVGKEKAADEQSSEVPGFSEQPELTPEVEPEPEQSSKLE
ncbi:MAG: hypothetical protein ACOYEQ_00565 [Bacillota bacterium]